MSLLTKIQSPQTIKLLRAMWADLHTFAANYPEHPNRAEVSGAQLWLDAWASQFPKDCPCRQGWVEALSVCGPPMRQGGHRLFCWTLAVHDRINAKLGKPIFWVGSTQHLLLADLQTLQITLDKE